MVLTENSARLVNFPSPFFYKKNGIGKWFRNAKVELNRVAINVLSVLFLQMFQSFESPFKHNSLP